MTDVVAAVCLLLFAFLGYRKGFLRALAPMVALIGGYAASVMLSRPIGDLLIARGLLKGFLAYTAGGVLAFLSVGFLVRALAHIAERILRKIRKDSPSRLEKLAGLAVGCGQGALLAVLLIWGITFYRGARAKLTRSTDDLPEPTISEQGTIWAVARLSELAMKAAGKGDDPMAKTIGALVSDPGSADRHLKKMLKNDSFSKAMKDKDLMRGLAKGDVSSLEDNEALKSLVSDEDFMRSARKLGIVSEGSDPKKLGKELSSAMGQLAERRGDLRNDPLLKTVLDDPKVRRMLEQGLPRGDGG
ncbi:CvpA family protein [Elusimicrobiota bacterium]